QRFRIQAQRSANYRKPDRRQTREERRPQRAQSGLGSVERIWAGVKAEFGNAARSAQWRRQRDEVSRLLLAGSRCVRNDDRRNAQDVGRLDGDTASALFATAHLGEIQARRKISSTGAEENSSALAQ